MANEIVYFSNAGKFYRREQVDDLTAVDTEISEADYLAAGSPELVQLTAEEKAMLKVIADEEAKAEKGK